MAQAVTNENISSAFLASAEEVETVFGSYRELHTIYSSSITTLRKELDKLPATYRSKILNAQRVFENVAGTVNERQEKISNQIYAQGLVLLVGNAESLTREMFHVLLKQNIRKVKIKKNVHLPLADVLSANTDEKLADVVLSTLESEGNPSEKLNFQNMQQLKGIMDSYLGIKIDDVLIQKLHEYWQIRHIIIHGSSIIDQRFIDNLKKAKLATNKYKLGAKVIVNKKSYEDCFGLLTLMFQVIDEEIARLKLTYNSEAL